MKLLKKLKKIIKKKPKINASVLFFESVIIILVVLVAFLISQIYQLYNSHNGDFDALPAKNTVFAYTWNPRLDLGFAKNIENNLDLPTLVKVANLEQIHIPVKLYRDLSVFNFTDKTLAYLWVEDKIVPVYLFKFDKFYKSKAVDYIMQHQKLGDWNISLRKNSFIISTSQSAIDTVLGSSQKITTDNLYLDSIVNIPKNSFGQFYIQHKLLNKYLANAQTILGPLSYTPYVLESFGVTVGSVVPTKDSIYLSTYTNPSSNVSEFPSSRETFSANILHDFEIPEGAVFYVSSQNLPLRLYDFLRNSGFEKSGNTISSVFNNVLVSYNLTEDTLSVLNKIFEKEFLLAIYPDKEFYFVFENLNSKLFGKMVSELTNLMQYFNPKVISFELPDGFLGKKLVPNETLEPKKMSENQYQFTFKELDQTIKLTTLKDYSVITNFTQKDPQLASLPDDTYAELLPISDELLYFSQEFLYKYLSDYFDLADVPKATTATNFFNDGIQTVTILKWSKD